MTKPESSVSCREDLYERLCDPECVTCYLNAALEENDEAAFQLAPRDVAEARSTPLPGNAAPMVERHRLPERVRHTVKARSEASGANHSNPHTANVVSSLITMFLPTIAGCVQVGFSDT
jgi:hypothetical protein